MVENSCDSCLSLQKSSHDPKVVRCVHGIVTHDSQYQPAPDSSLLTLREGIRVCKKDSYLANEQGWIVCTPSTIDLIIEAVEQWLVLHHLYGCDFSTIPVSKISQMVSEKLFSVLAAMSSGPCEWYAYFKYFNAAFYTYQLDQIDFLERPELPPTPNWLDDRVNGLKSLFGGAVYIWLRRFRHDDPHRFRSFLVSINMSKKGMPRPGPESVLNSVRKTFKALTTSREVSIPLQVSLPEHVWVKRRVCTKAFISCRHPSLKLKGEELVFQARRTVEEIFVGQTPTLFDISGKPFLPSGSANYNRSRGKMGTYGELENLPFWQDFMNDPDFDVRIRHRMLKLRGYVSEYYGRTGVFDQFEGELLHNIDSVIGVEIDSTGFRKAFTRFYWRCVDFALKEDANVTLVGLSEALKVRTISKGPPITYFVLKPFQKQFLKTVQRFPLFELTGTPVTEEIINDKFGRRAGVFSEEAYHSGDLDSATDKMESWFSEEIADAIFDIYDKESGFSWMNFRILVKRALTQHLIEDPDNKGCFVPQTIGQLMGSIISFPILCVGNAAASRFALEVTTGRTCPLRKFPGWINGDDVVTRYPRGLDFDIIWTAVLAFFGFNKSWGKCFDSAKFFNINSTTFELDRCTGNFSLTRYINLGLVYGMKRSTSAACEQLDCFELAIHQNELYNTCPSELRETLLSFFIHCNWKALKTFTGPWFVPLWAGGLGLKSDVYKLDYQDTRQVLQARHALVMDPSLQPIYTGSAEWQHYNQWYKFCSSIGLLDRYYYKEVCPRRRVCVPFKPESFEAADGLASVSYLLWNMHGQAKGVLYEPRKAEWIQTLKKCDKLRSLCREIKLVGYDHSVRCRDITVLENKPYVIPVLERWD